MNKKDKYILLFISLMIIAIIVMVIFIYLDRRESISNINPVIDEDPEIIVDVESEIPSLTPGDTIEDIEKDIDSLTIKDIELEFDLLEREIEESF